MDLKYISVLLISGMVCLTVVLGPKILDMLLSLTDPLLRGHWGRETQPLLDPELLDQRIENEVYCMPNLTRSPISCGVYMMSGVNYCQPTKKEIERIARRSHDMGRDHGGMQGIYPVIILFSDKDDDYRAENRGENREIVKGSWGDAWQKKLIELGYKCDKFQLGKNPKSNNDISIYHWYVHAGKTGAPSLVREYTYEKQQRSSRDSKPRAAEGTGAAAAGSTGGVAGVRRKGLLGQAIRRRVGLRRGPRD